METQTNSSPIQLVEWLSAQGNTDTKNVMETTPSKEQNWGYILAQKFIEFNILLNVNKTIWIYNTDKGCYENLNQNLNQLLRQNLPPEYACSCTLHRDREILAWLCSLLPMQYRLEEYPNLINFRNGTYDVESGTLIAHSPYFQFTYCLEMEFTDTLKETPIFDQFIYDVTSGDSEFATTLYEFLGYTISNTRTLKALFFLYGPSNTGKSVFINLLSAILGPNLSTSVPLAALGKNFRTVALMGSRLNAFSETDFILEKDIPLLKSLTGGGRINADNETPRSRATGYQPETRSARH